NPHPRRSAVITKPHNLGFCGAYMIFSTYGLESNSFLAKGDTTMLLVYFVGTAIVGMICVQIGVLLARLGFPKT
ncbi:MAG: hypothetical protein ACRC2M_21000, partial [Planktothrix sp.]